ncbi:MAG TPA: prepilin-type N-terminal cleavage/methylation domain-containing protein [Candidatus Saccharimonadales bacterium]|nr:prepilin-type N-terminal cleavage/methylation domain-containing protein [Candidatus Saccharimonadales bacterium]
MKPKPANSKGFTVIELMVATSVFALVLVVVTSGILQVSRLYYKGVNAANTQSVARSITDTISQTIQFAGGAVEPTTAGAATPSAPKVLCIGNQRFVYALGWQVTDGAPNSTKHQSFHGLVQDNVSSCGPSSTQPLDVPGVVGREMLSPGMRLSKLNVTDLGANLYRVEVRIIYGDDDLLKDPNNPETSCINQTAGTQFCTISELSTVVTKRVR